MPMVIVTHSWFNQYFKGGIENSMPKQKHLLYVTAYYGFFEKLLAGLDKYGCEN